MTTTMSTALRTSTALHTAANRCLCIGVTALVLQSCSNAPKVPDWQMEAKGAMDRAVAAYLVGNARVDRAELSRARLELSSTGRTDLMANAELLQCAAQVASLVFEPCTDFDAFGEDADATQKAYADYLRGQVTTPQIALLPAAQRGAATRTVGDAQPLQGIDDPLSILVAAAVLLETGKANPAILQQAVDTASSQGWRRPLLAWLGVQAQRATQAGQSEQAARLLRRIALVQGTASPVK